MAQEPAFPSRPITVVVGSSSGSSMEFEMRILSEKFKELTGHPILIDIRPGANGATGATYVMRAKPDGYTLFTSPASPMVFNPLTHKNLNYDPKKMTPIIEIGAQPLVLATRGDLPANSVADMITYAKGKPGNVFYSSTGIGGGNHMSVLLKSTTPNNDRYYIARRFSTPISGPSHSCRCGAIDWCRPCPRRLGWTCDAG
jgi:tripartite-type tricarboxylate transporter receptor subunit TctC